MSTLKTNNAQIGQSATATNNFTLYQPASPDGTVRLAVGNSGATSLDVLKADNTGLITVPGNLTVTGNITSTGSVPTERIVQGTAQTTNGASNYEYTGLPSWVKRITLITDNCKGPGAAIQIGTSSGYATSGYNGVYTNLATSTLGSATIASGVVWSIVVDVTYVGYGTVVFTSLGTGNIWSFVGYGSNVAYTRQELVTGSVTLSSTLDRIKLTGSGNFTGGTVNIIYEG